MQVGEYVYELTREEGLVGQRLTGHQVWPSTIKHAVVGWTDLSDVEIQEACMSYPLPPFLSMHRNIGAANDLIASELTSM